MQIKYKVAAGWDGGKQQSTAPFAAAKRRLARECASRRGRTGEREKVASLAWRPCIRGSALPGEGENSMHARREGNNERCGLRSYDDRFNDVSGWAHSPRAARPSALLIQRSIKLDRDRSCAGKMDRDV